MAHAEVIYGPPGTGKSRTLIEKVQDYLDWPEHRGDVLVCSYTKSAAQTIIDRWMDPLAPESRLKVATLHSFCFGQLKLNRSQVVDDEKMKFFLGDFGLDLEEGSDGVKYQELLSYAGAVGISPMAAYDVSMQTVSRTHFEAAANSYFKWKETYGYVDYNDMLNLYLKVKKAPNISLLVIDEAQDLSNLHWKVINHLCDIIPGLRVMIAGDDDQALYAYSGVDPHGMDNFAEEHEANIRVLKQSYRVPRTMWRSATAIANRLSRRVAKEYAPKDADGRIIRLGDINYMPGMLSTHKDTLILYSDRFIRDDVEEHLKSQLVPYITFSGMPAPLQTKGGKALRAAAKNVLGPEDMQTIRRGLTAYGVDIWDRVSHDEVVRRLRDRDMKLVVHHWTNERYLQSVDLSSDVNIRISTIHGAKGAEAAEVHLVTGMSQGAVDHSFKDPDAPHRLMYVGVTRASETLFLYESDNAYPIP